MTKKVILIIFCIFFLISVEANNKTRILVLGFQSKNLNLIQRRMLRESIMRKISEKGYSIVPIMEIENYFLGNNKVNIETHDSSKQRKYAKDLKAGLVIYGELFQKNTNQYKVQFFLYYPQKRIIKKKNMLIASKSNYLSLFSKVSELVITFLKKENY